MQKNEGELKAEPGRSACKTKASTAWRVRPAFYNKKSNWPAPTGGAGPGINSDAGVDELGQLGLGQGAHLGVDGVAILEYDQGWNTANAEFFGN